MSMINEYIQIALNLATLLTALVSLLTLFEMRKQRIATIQPDLVVSSLDSVHLYYLPQMQLYASWPYYWSIEYLEDLSNPCDKHSRGAFDIQLKNIGAGTAKDISLSWDLDVEPFVDAISKLNLDVDIYFDKDYQGKMSLFRVNAMAFFDESNVNSKNVFFLSVGDNYEMPFFQVYTQLVSLWLYGKLFINDPFKLDGIDAQKYIVDEFMNLPTPSLSISYKDMAGNEYKKKYSYKLGFSSFSNVSCSFYVEIIS